MSRRLDEETSYKGIPFAMGFMDAALAFWDGMNSSPNPSIISNPLSLSEASPLLFFSVRSWLSSPMKAPSQTRAQRPSRSFKSEFAWSQLRSTFKARSIELSISVNSAHSPMFFLPSSLHCQGFLTPHKQAYSIQHSIQQNYSSLHILTSNHLHCIGGCPNSASVTA